jgi:hypothetical protein
MSHSHGFSPKSISAILVSTFVLGFVSGAVFFFLSHTGSSTVPEATDEEIDFSIVVRTRGGCMRVGCPYYKIEENGAFTYVNPGTAERYEGMLEKEEIIALKSEMEQLDLPSFERSVFTGQCPIIYDGLAYAYTLTHAGTMYTLDSCTHALDTQLFFSKLNAFVDTLGDPHKTSL